MKCVGTVLALLVSVGLVVAGCQKAPQNTVSSGPPGGKAMGGKAPGAGLQKSKAMVPSGGAEAAKAPESGAKGNEGASGATGEGIAWETSYDKALEKARAEKKLVFVDFKASWCGPCKQLEAEAYPRADVQAKLAGAIAVMVDVDENQDLAKQFNVTGVPYLIVVDADGNKVADQTGYSGPDGLLAFLEKALATKS